MTSELICFGESLLRIATPLGVPYSQAEQMSYHVGGAELNVAVNVANLGKKACWVSVLTDDELGDDILHRIKNQGVDTRHVLRRPGSVGVYFVEKAALPRGYRVLKRQKSVLGEVGESQVSTQDLNWQKIFEGAKCFFTTGITAGLSPWSCQQVVHAMQIARERGMCTAFDFNFRAKLWSQEQAKAAFAKIMPYVDVLLGSEADLRVFLDTTVEGAISRFNTMILSERTEQNEYKLCLYQNGEKFTSKSFPFQNIDRIGVGDAMAAGVLYGRLAGWNPQQLVDFAAACGAIKYSVEGDWNLVTLQDVEKVLANPRGGISR